MLSQIHVNLSSSTSFRIERLGMLFHLERDDMKFMGMDLLIFIF